MKDASTRVALDPLLTEELRPSTPGSAWKKRLTTLGLMDVEPDQSPEGQLIARLQSLVRAMPDNDVVTHGLAPKVFVPEAVMSLKMINPVWAAFGLGMLAMLAIGTLSQGFFCVLVITPAFPLVWQLFQRVPTPDQTSPINPHQQAHDTLQDLVEREFILAIGHHVVECLPTLRRLDERVAQVAELEGRARKQIQRMEATRDRIQAVNQEIGQSKDDPETQALSAALAAEVRRLESLQKLSQDLRQRQAQWQEQTAQWRLRVERQALSEATSRLTLTPGRAPPSEQAARIDLARIDHEIAAMTQQIADEERRISAMIELTDATNRPVLPRAKELK